MEDDTKTDKALKMTFDELVEHAIKKRRARVAEAEVPGQQKPKKVAVTCHECGGRGHMGSVCPSAKNAHGQVPFPLPPLPSSSPPPPAVQQQLGSASAIETLQQQVLHLQQVQQILLQVVGAGGPAMPGLGLSMGMLRCPSQMGHVAPVGSVRTSAPPPPAQQWTSF